ncbi:4-hydroxyphenylacetate 3-monooxygenase, oxygenase component [Caldibacillus lycopersici]|uniref:4-hydroxyphenylacetate 3-monooxygenase, oxygenase component n=1 Tax=Perspicuibacillus lycopersici TaxID=1325689 RepID=A0AAE3LNM5_9BACI|nr:4-hydroxyphenylacetate 3-monooxygenase, oxygenase component [Perspicuibacillus lycopersici]MCU9614890.1 4-hydroxyphenylacetate 3-monooxygenase, oxygenase component [Perspicuibacillus lycopersici]
MGVINGQDYINRIDQLNNEIWLDGKRMEGKISEHPAFKGIMKTKASLYDMQHDPALKNMMTFQATETGEPIGLSYLQPKTKEDLFKRRRMTELWARQTFGMMGRSPDYLNTVIMSFAAAAPLLRGRDKCFPENIESLYKLAKANDLSFAHTFVTPQVNRSQGYFESSDDPISAKVVDRNPDGIVIKGARLLATQGGMTDEVLVYSTPKFLFDENEAYAFSIPSNTKGLKFICRESFSLGDSTFNYPLSARFEEMDTIVVFDHVLVPWNRVFFYDNPEAAADFFAQCGFNPFALHQVVTRQIVKTEFILGLAELLVSSINVSEYQHIQEKMSEIIVGLETMKALLEKAENDSDLDQWGVLRPSIYPLHAAINMFPKIYPRFTEIIQKIGASGMISLPTEHDFDSPIRKDLEQYLQSANQNAINRVKIFRLAWDLTMSPFGTRQMQYERYFFGDPIRLAGSLYHSYPKDDYVNQVNHFLEIRKDK